MIDLFGSSFRTYRDDVVRALLQKHEEDCREDRLRTDAKFEEIREDMAGFRADFGDYVKSQGVQHASNVKELAGIKWYIAAAAGGFAVFLFLADHGTKIVSLLSAAK